MNIIALGAAALTLAAPAHISSQQAVKIALHEVPGAHVKEVDWERRGVWEVELVKRGVEHEFDIDARTGKVLKHELDD